MGFVTRATDRRPIPQDHPEGDQLEAEEDRQEEE
jgi:hypothetical protein